MKTLLSFITFFSFLLSVNVYSQPGILDCDFNSDGKVITDYGADNDYASAIAVQTDGKIIVVGKTLDATTYEDLLITRYTPDGNTDLSFATNGFDTLDFGNYRDVPNSVIIQPDGKIIVGGFSYDFSSTQKYFVARYNADGNLDPAFGINGKIFSQINGMSTHVSSMVLADDGKIILGGAYNLDFMVIRLLSDGSIDNTFGTNGYVTTDIKPDEIVTKMAIQQDGKILAAGITGSISTKYDFALLRYNPNGTLDSTFSYDGMLYTTFGTYDDECNDIVVAPDGKIFLAGTSSLNPTNSFAIVKYNTDGSIDLSFNQCGKVIIPIQNTSTCTSVALQTDDKIILSGHSRDASSNSDFTLLRLNPDGSIDSTFGTSGEVFTDFGSNSDAVTSMAIQPNGRILLAGKTSISPYDYMAIARYISGVNAGIIDFDKDANSVFIYPNPVNSETVIEYELINDEIISIDLFDISGKFIKSFISNESQSKGKHKETLNFDESMPAGSYLLAIKNNSTSFNIKIIKN